MLFSLRRISFFGWEGSVPFGRRVGVWSGRAARWDAHSRRCMMGDVVAHRPRLAFGLPRLELFDVGPCSHKGAQQVESEGCWRQLRCRVHARNSSRALEWGWFAECAGTRTSEMSSLLLREFKGGAHAFTLAFDSMGNRLRRGCTSLGARLGAYIWWSAGLGALDVVSCAEENAAGVR